uniref:Uncharacterized protein n=1 Tax=Ralstonia solanacearum TaxID=305 RepID=A0A0S4UPC3_RALSL|nr:protein of unknown function [Ralstonia solanacearum]CUV37634.1 protein of unknown function [Ralstonia solanacearum]CUV38856.1 protein of unknown function [Ralstonia solanacearum]
MHTFAIHVEQTSLRFIEEAPPRRTQ